MTFACSSAVSYVASSAVVHSSERTRGCSACVGGGWLFVTLGSEPLAGGSICVPVVSKVWNRWAGTTHRERLLNHALGDDDCDALDVETVFLRTRERELAFLKRLERGEEHSVSLDRVVAECTGVHCDQFSLPRTLRKQVRGNV